MVKMVFVGVAHEKYARVVDDKKIKDLVRKNKDVILDAISEVDAKTYLLVESAVIPEIHKISKSQKIVASMRAHIGKIWKLFFYSIFRFVEKTELFGEEIIKEFLSTEQAKETISLISLLKELVSVQKIAGKYYIARQVLRKVPDMEEAIVSAVVGEKKGIEKINAFCSELEMRLVYLFLEYERRYTAGRDEEMITKLKKEIKNYPVVMLLAGFEHVKVAKAYFPEAKVFSVDVGWNQHGLFA